MKIPRDKLSRILLLEDDHNLRQGIALALQFHGFEVHHVADGVEGLDALTDFRPDLIISDINMPRMNGLDFFRNMRKIPDLTQIPFIFLTGNNASHDIQSGRELGIEDYITKPIQTENLLRIVNARLLRAAEIRTAHLNEAFLQTIQVLANTIESKDHHTPGHLDRVSRYAVWFAQELGWSEEQITDVQYGARLHDIGKIIVPDHILNKPGQLDPEEWALIRRHPVEGVRIIDEIPLLTGAIPFIRAHHEKWDGSGYPDGLAGEQIPIEGRLLAIVDVFDAMTSDRAYRKSLSIKEAAAYISEKAGSEFDPELADVFLRVVDRYIAPSFYPE